MHPRQLDGMFRLRYREGLDSRPESDWRAAVVLIAMTGLVW
jgi:hypothetical protein